MSRALVVPEGWRQGAALARLRKVADEWDHHAPSVVSVSYHFMRYLLTDMLVAHLQHGDRFNPSDDQVARGVFAVVGQVEVRYDGMQSVDIVILR